MLKNNYVRILVSALSSHRLSQYTVRHASIFVSVISPYTTAYLLRRKAILRLSETLEPLSEVANH